MIRIMNKSLRYLVAVLAFSFVLIPINLYGKNSPEMLYNQQKYKEALNSLIELEKRGGGSAELYVNIGNAAYHANDYALSILYFHKALNRDPYLLQAKNNLAYLQQKVSDRNLAQLKDKKTNITVETRFILSPNF